MSEISNILNLLEDIQKQLTTAQGEASGQDVGSLKTTIAALQSSVAAVQTSVGSLQNSVSTMENQTIPTLQASIPTSEISALQEGLTDLQNNVIPQLEQKIPTETVQSLQNSVAAVQTSVGSLQSSVSTMENQTIPTLQASIPTSEISALQSTVSNLQNVVIPQLQEQINSLGGAAGAKETWLTLYDKDSTDENINWGFTQGIGGSYTINGCLPNVLQYKKLKFTYNYEGNHVEKFCNLADLEANNECSIGILMTNMLRSNYILSTSVLISLNADGTTNLASKAAMLLQFTNAKTVTIVNRKHPDSTACFSKIEGVL